jgi:hypothetical protein
VNKELELKVFLAAGRLETLELERDQAEFELLDTLREAIGEGLSLEAAARAANMTHAQLQLRLAHEASTAWPFPDPSHDASGVIPHRVTSS